MQSDQTSVIPFVLSMEVDDDNEGESEYRIRIGNKVKYLKIAPATFDRNTLSFPLPSLPSLPYNDDNWTVAHISRDVGSGELRTSLSKQRMATVQNVWHSTEVDVLDLERVERLTATAFEAVICATTHSTLNAATILPHRSRIVAKIARFEWEIPRIERETRAYQLLEQKDPGLAPRFLGHIREGDRVMGLLLEKVEGSRNAVISDLHDCKLALGRLHNLGVLHSDVNRHNFLVGSDGVKLIDFERCQENATELSKTLEMQSLRAELDDRSGRGASFVFSS
ncbi:alpha-galactosidase A [Pyrenochaeta sp. DS3sAY3a]|nr:alpha-galactosidase A [Pyrenochaeta sp. DS3sAY3a]